MVGKFHTFQSHILFKHSCLFTFWRCLSELAKRKILYLKINTNITKNWKLNFQKDCKKLCAQKFSMFANSFPKWRYNLIQSRDITNQWINTTPSRSLAVKMKGTFMRDPLSDLCTWCAEIHNGQPTCYFVKYIHLITDFWFNWYTRKPF